VSRAINAASWLREELFAVLYDHESTEDRWAELRHQGAGGRGLTSCVRARACARRVCIGAVDQVKRNSWAPGALIMVAASAASL
jgi:hypothetical protein